MARVAEISRTDLLQELDTKQNFLLEQVAARRARLRVAGIPESERQQLEHAIVADGAAALAIEDTSESIRARAVLGSRRLIDIKRPDVELFLVKVANLGMGWSILQPIASHLGTAMLYAMDADYIPKNPCRKVELPMCRPPKETRAITVDEVQRLWDKTEGTDYLIWRILLLTGARISELLALERTDVLPDGRLRIDESALNRMPPTTKNKKTRIAPLPASLREELEEHLASHRHQLVFPHPDGKMATHEDSHIRSMVDRARTAAGIPDLTPRMCRTTFATLFEGDIRDAQEILGHHSPGFTLQTYRKPITARQTAAIEALDQRLKVVPIRKGA